MARSLILAALIALIPVLCSSFTPESPTDRRILVLLDDLAIRSSHSLYFNSIASRGYELDFKLADDPKIALHRYGQYLYDALVLFCPTTERFGGSVDQAAVLEFVDSGHDLIIAADSSASDVIREIATECGADFDEEGIELNSVDFDPLHPKVLIGYQLSDCYMGFMQDSKAKVIDHVGYAVSDNEGDHTIIASDNFIQSDVILGSSKIEAPVLFQGIGHSLNPANSLVFKALSASPSAYSANPDAKLSNPPALSGSAISLVSVMQARNNARVLISGSLSMFSNRLFRAGVQKARSSTKHEKSGNEQFLTEISKWIFHERGHLKALNVRHNKVGEKDEPAVYRINDDLEYSVEIYEWSGASWEPYAANDVQVQFYMMSPYVLKNLTPNKKGVFSTSFKVPDVYGVFQFKVEYDRLGYTSLSLSKQIPVRPFKHNEYERFIPAAYPYYTATFSMMVGFFIFTIVHLYNK